MREVLGQERQNPRFIRLRTVRIQVDVCGTFDGPELLWLAGCLKEAPAFGQRRVFVLRPRRHQDRRFDRRDRFYGAQIIGGYSKPQRKLPKEDRRQDLSGIAEASCQAIRDGCRNCWIHRLEHDRVRGWLCFRENKRCGAQRDGYNTDWLTRQFPSKVSECRFDAFSLPQTERDPVTRTLAVCGQIDEKYRVPIASKQSRPLDHLSAVGADAMQQEY